MAGAAVSVTIKWGNKDNDTFSVSAKTLADALKALEARDEWGRFSGTIGYEYTDANGIVTDVTLKPSYAIEMPKWSGYSSAPKECKDEWDRMWAALEKHEDGHREVHQKALDDFEAALGKKKDYKVAQLKTDHQKMIKTMNDNQKKFDSTTGNGSKTGVTLDVTEACQ